MKQMLVCEKGSNRYAIMDPALSGENHDANLARKNWTSITLFQNLINHEYKQSYSNYEGVNS